MVLTYLSSVVGPALATAPGITETGWVTILRTRFAPRLKGAGMQMIDVRDVAAVHSAAMRPGVGPRRYVCGGQFLSFDQMIAVLEDGSGVVVRRIPLPPRAFRALGRISDVLAGIIPVGGAFSYEAAQLITAAVPTDDSRTLNDLGLQWRSAREAILSTFDPIDER